MQPSRSSQNALSLFALSPEPSYALRAEPTDPDAHQFLALWREQTRGRDLIIGKDISSRPVARFLANLMVVEPINDDADCRVRLAGSLVRRRYGREVSGQRLSALFSWDIFERHIADMREVRRTGEPLILLATVPQETSGPRTFDVVILRVLAPDGKSMWNIVGIFMITE